MWLPFTDGEFQRLQEQLTAAGLNNVALDLRRKAHDYLEADAQRRKFVTAAMERYANQEDYQTDVDPDAAISQSDEGSFVQAWVWVPNEEAGLPNPFDEEEDDA